ncbi:hypothetical protein PENTCL1PPCAC_6629 [Pristionchus entomophagus]|uniref:Uncharacterized protein n=1 Tax=Pristionchus entomophagus TaxID=358040 RepID=A0AAV5SNG0_9BILA|nr:hypothetical protein PENTCL1PPCAC_6629 [Pristionchus entomophagus]
MNTIYSVHFFKDQEQLDDEKLKFSVFLPSRLILNDLESLVESTPKRAMDGHDLTFLLRLFNLIGGANYYCSIHAHDLNTGCCGAIERNDQPTQSSRTIEDFFDEVRAERTALKQYALRTEKLSARLRPYQRDAVRFMIDRELRPNLRIHFSWFYCHIKMEIDEMTLYYLPNLAFFLSTCPVLPTLSTCGGVLAEDMGLGKTVELLALITTVTPDHTPVVVETTGENTKMDEVGEVLDDLISNVVASVEGEKAVSQFKRKKEVGMMYYSKSSSPTKHKMIICEECGTSCVQQRVHWSPGLSTQTRFVCPECIMITKELIPIKTTLIVVPNAIAHQWYEEIRKHVKDEVKIDVYKGVSVDGYKHPHYLNQFDIVITTYDVITKEKSFLEFHNPNERLRKRSYDIAKSACTPLFSVVWWRVCLDESQRVQGGSSTISILCKGLESRARWSITGTPISSSIKDVYGLVNFLGLNPLDKEWIFDQCLYIPYINNKNRRPLIFFMSKIMWRTEKKHLEASKSRVISHVEMVSLSPMEERMYSDLLARCKEKVVDVVRDISVNTRLSGISRQLRSKLLGALSRVELFLLTSLSGDRRLRRMNDNGNDNDDHFKLSSFHMFTPESLFRRLLSEKKRMVTREQREVVMRMNGIAAILWYQGHYEQSLSCYAKALNLMLSTRSLNRKLDQPDAVVFTSREMCDEKGDDKEKDERIEGKPLTCDSLQFVHIYRNVQWLLTSRPELADKNNLDMREITPLFHQAWRTYCRIEESMYREKESEWQRVRDGVKNQHTKISTAFKWIDKLSSIADGMKNSEGQDIINFELNVERRVGIRFSNLRVMSGWMKNQLSIVDSLSHDIIELIDRCIEVSNGDDLDEFVNDGTYRMSDILRVVKSPKKKQNVSERNGEERGEMDLPMEQIIGPRKRGLKENIVEIKNMEDEEKFGVDLMKILEREVKDLYDHCVFCMNDGEFDEISQESCLFCATQAMYQRMQLKDNCGKPSRSRMAVLESMEREIYLSVYRFKSIAKEEEEELKESKKMWKETIHACNSLDSFWRSSLIVMLEKMNRVRELRQCTVRSERDEKLGDEEMKLEKAKGTMDKAISNLNYVMSLREESGLTRETGSASSSSCSSSSSVNPCTNPSSRECPICYEEIGETWFVFPCAHLNCGKCFNRLTKLHGDRRLPCSVCRSIYPQVAVMYVSNKKKDEISTLSLNCKLDKIVRVAVSILKENRHDKMLVFTSYTIGSDVLKNVFTKANFPFVALDSDPQRNSDVLSKFRNDPFTRILLMRYESGGKGLNLTIANHIIFADTVDDVSLEKQAIGRCDRIGQKKDVHLHYVIAQDTVEERMYHLTREVTATSYRQDDDWTVGTLIDLFTQF